MKSETATTKDQVSEIAAAIWQEVQAHGSVNVAFTHKPLSAKEISVRTVSQNDMKEQQVHTIALQLYGGDENWTRNELKYRCGVPILCRDEPEFLAFCEVALKHLNHEQRIQAMEYVPVTSRMGVKQMSEYIEKVFMMYAEKVNFGTLGEAA